MEKNFLVISNSIDPEYGGPAFSSTLSAIGMAKQKAKLTFVVPVLKEFSYRSKELVDRMLDEGVDVKQFPIELRFSIAKRFFLSFKLLYWIVNNIKFYDAIIVRSPWAAASLWAIFFGRILGIGKRCYISPHESFTNFDINRTGGWVKRYFKESIGLWMINSVRGVIYSSELEQENSEKTYGCCRSWVALHPVSKPPFFPERNGKIEKIVFSYFGRLHKKKNIDLVIKSFALVENKNSRLVIGGAGPEESSLKELATKLNVDDRVDWYGLVLPENKSEFFNSVDILVTPSDFECFGMSIAEAICFGVPVITTEMTGLSGVIDKYKCGRIVNKSVEDICEAMNFYSNGEDEYISARNSCEIASLELSIEKHGAQMISIIEGRSNE